MGDEISAHLALLTEENLRHGMSPEEARHAARRTFGGVEQIKERCRDARGGRWAGQARQDFGYAVRGLRKNLGFTFAAVVSLAVGIGAVTTIFSVADAVLLRPLPYAAADRLVTLWTTNSGAGAGRQPTGFADIEDWRKSSAAVFDGVAVYDPISVVVGSGESRRASAMLASPELAELLGARPQLGRMFTAADAARREPVTVISFSAWQRHYGGAADILGRRVELDGRPTEIVGVMPDSFRFPGEQTQFWLPHTAARGWDNARLARGPGPWRTLARLAPEVARSTVESGLSRLARALQREYPATNTGLGVAMVPLAEHVVSRELRTALVLLLAAVGAVLLIACSNVGNLLLARGLTRQREFALRLSLGATRGRLVAQLFVENVVLGLFAAVIGSGLAWFGVRAVRAFGPADIPRLEETALDLRILGFAVVVALGSTCVFGLLPALQSTRRDALSVLREGARGSTDAPRGKRLRSALVVVEFALAVLLFAGAGMLVRSFIRLLAVDPGFKVENVLIAPMRLAAHRPATDAIPFAAAVVERVAALPGVSAAAISEEVLLGERGVQTLSMEPATTPAKTSVSLVLGNDAVTPDYFRAVGVALREGRLFTMGDGPTAPPVAIVSETLARILWPDGRAVGRRLRLGGSNSTQPWAVVVGVVGDQRRQTLDRAPIAQVFWPVAQRPSRAMNLIVATEMEPAALADTIRRTIQSVDATVPVEPITTLRQQLDRTVAPRRFQTGLLTGFAAIAFVLAGTGIFGLMHFSVARRTREIGVRVALGAGTALILRQILREGLTLAVAGVVLGIAGAIALSRVFAALLFGIGPADPVSLAAAAGALVAIAALACFFPARNASRIDPLTALRCD